jgi:hypothetical protein
LVKYELVTTGNLTPVRTIKLVRPVVSDAMHG